MISERCYSQSYFKALKQYQKYSLIFRRENPRVDTQTQDLPTFEPQSSKKTRATVESGGSINLEIPTNPINHSYNVLPETGDVNKHRVNAGANYSVQNESELKSQSEDIIAKDGIISNQTAIADDGSGFSHDNNNDRKRKISSPYSPIPFFKEDSSMVNAGGDVKLNIPTNPINHYYNVLTKMGDVNDNGVNVKHCAQNESELKSQSKDIIAQDCIILNQTTVTDDVSVLSKCDNHDRKRKMSSQLPPQRDSQIVMMINKLKRAKLILPRVDNRLITKDSKDHYLETSKGSKQRLTNVCEEGSESAISNATIIQRKNATKTNDIIYIDVDATDSSNRDDCAANNNLRHVPKDTEPSLGKIDTCETQCKPSGCIVNDTSHAAKESATVTNEDHPVEDPSAISRPETKYPVFCPVWFDMQYSKPCSKYLDASRGIVRSFSRKKQQMVYEVEKKCKIGANSLDTESVYATVTEDELAFAVHCPVLVSMHNVKTSELEGEIINVKPCRLDNGKWCRIMYTVMLTTNEGRCRIEEGVEAERIRYRMSIQAQQSRIRDIIASPRIKGVGIRTNERGEPTLNKSPPMLKVKKRPYLPVTATEHCNSSGHSSSSDSDGNSSSHEDIIFSKLMSEEPGHPRDSSSLTKSKKTSNRRRYRGVTFRKVGERYEARVSFNSKQRLLGHYKSEVEAALAYDIGASMFGRSNWVNFRSREEYELAIQGASGKHVLNGRESYAAVLAKVKTQVSKYFPDSEVNENTQFKASEKDTMQVSSPEHHIEQKANRPEDQQSRPPINGDIETVNEKAQLKQSKERKQLANLEHRIAHKTNRGEDQQPLPLLNGGIEIVNEKTQFKASEKDSMQQLNPELHIEHKTNRDEDQQSRLSINEDIETVSKQSQVQTFQKETIQPSSSKHRIEQTTNKDEDQQSRPSNNGDIETVSEKTEFKAFEKERTQPSNSGHRIERKTVRDEDQQLRPSSCAKETSWQNQTQIVFEL
eukprot:CAMPEP_0181082768 /NCGR_PEP_ID=MMETSP1071-20121207/3797_1 /TAXON_ID=35127 /ORGANISM="Thalassiosira sp., Strain NH16" /LENGTH=985 /DNA_ID=CAMNT_0023164375 /DNA_START=41 /DNA_END=2999 /DNA_ORIENTATION=-